MFETTRDINLITMKRIERSYIKAKEIIRKENARYEYRYVLPTSLLLCLAGYFVRNTFGDILFLLGIIGSPIAFFLQGFWVFVIYLIKPE